jgi:hypothetical protein
VPAETLDWQLPNGSMATGSGQPLAGRRQDRGEFPTEFMLQRFARSVAPNVTTTYLGTALQ